MTRFQILPVLPVLLLIAHGCAGSATAPALNSDRIAARYGSYAVRVLQQDDEWRLSSLESREQSTPTTRTLAVVRYARPLPAELREMHAQITGGASIGATFRDAGWSVRKKNLYSGTRRVGIHDRAIVRLMRLSPPADLAAHAYRFDVVRDSTRHAYATIVELHHPHYLDLAELRGLFALAAPQAGATVPPDVREALQHVASLSVADYTGRGNP